MNVNSASFGIVFLQKVLFSQKYFYEAFLTHAGKSNTVLLAWTEVGYQIFACWELQTMWNLHDVYEEACSSQEIFTNGFTTTSNSWNDSLWSGNK